MAFKATGADGSPIYHTNVMMAIGSTYAVVCSESVADENERQHLLARLHQTHQVCTDRPFVLLARACADFRGCSSVWSSLRRHPVDTCPVPGIAHSLLPVGGNERQHLLACLHRCSNVCTIAACTGMLIHHVLQGHVPA